MDGGLLKGAEVISLIGDSSRGAHIETIESSLIDSDNPEESIEEIVRNLQGLNLVKREGDVFYLTDSGKKMYHQLKRKYV